MNFFNSSGQNTQTSTGAAPTQEKPQQTEAVGFMEKLNETLGGGAKSEAKEGVLASSILHAHLS